MKITETARYRLFLICRGYTTPKDPIVTPNSGPGGYSQFIYLLLGSGVAQIGEDSVPLTHQTLTDLSAYKGREITYTATTELASWVCFNPLLPDTSLNVSILAAPTELTLLDGELETYIVPIKGSVEVNGKTIEEFKSGRLLIGKEANLSVPEGSICSIVKVVREVAQ